MHQTNMMALADTSLPVRGAWIEITGVVFFCALRGSRSPCGERGLKLQLHSDFPDTRVSLPVRGAWIEILS